MTSGESSARALLEDSIETLNKKFVKNSWFDYKGNNFDDKYKILNNIFTKEGKEGIRRFLKSVSNQNMEKCKIIKKKLFFPKKKNEIIQNKEKE